MTNIRTIIILFISLTILASCVNDTKKINNPSDYEFTRNGESSVSFGGQTTRIDMATELADGLLDFNLGESILLEMFANQTASGEDANPFSASNLNESTKSIKSKVAASEDFFIANTSESSMIKSTMESWITAQVNEVFPFQNELAEAGKAGQIADGSSARYVNVKGLEYNQAFSKSIIGAMMLDQINNHYLSKAVLEAGTNVTDNDNSVTIEAKPYTSMEHKWDEAYGYLFGKSTNSADPLISLGDDNFLNKYLGKVSDDADFSETAQDVWNAFKLGRAAIVAGDYDTRDEQIDIIQGELSKVIAIRAVYYLQQGKNALPISGNDYGPAFHDLSEAYGFIYSLRFTRIPGTKVSNFSGSEIDDFLGDLMEGNGFWDITADKLNEISEAIASKFEFTVEEAGE